MANSQTLLNDFVYNVDQLLQALSVKIKDGEHATRMMMRVGNHRVHLERQVAMLKQHGLGTKSPVDVKIIRP